MQDLNGLKFGRWTILKFSHQNAKKNHSYWWCRCDCGTERIVEGTSVKSGHTLSCGCWNREQHTLPLGEAAFRAILRNYREGAKRRGLHYSLSVEEFRRIIALDCHYCGRPPEQWIEHSTKRTYHGNYVYNGIDRVNNLVGYVSDNCVPCCSTCNAAKSNMTKEDFLAWVGRIYHRHSLVIEPRAQLLSSDVQQPVHRQSSQPEH